MNGCLNDARLLEYYAIREFKIPESRITRLLGEAATRKAILSLFHTRLLESSDISPGDIVIFFYAGHGTRMRAPAGWKTSDDQIEAICPYDQTTGKRGDEGVPPIPDITIHELFRLLEKKKRPNFVRVLSALLLTR